MNTHRVSEAFNLPAKVQQKNRSTAKVVMLERSHRGEASLGQELTIYTRNSILSDGYVASENIPNVNREL
jgi:hypothetical protein